MIGCCAADSAFIDIGVSTATVRRSNENVANRSLAIEDANPYMVFILVSLCIDKNPIKNHRCLHHVFG